ncbi:MAG: hypothetical protein Q7V88_03640 [Actinomycetota bacterium]|nr:hypothetical protein [Actinomycetota bacterium]
MPLPFALLVALLAACSDPAPTRVVRGADDVQVMQPEEVAANRLPPIVPDTVASGGSTVPAGSPGATAGTTGTLAGGTAGGTAGDTAAATDTIPQNVDDRPPELRLFEAFGEFRSCLDDKGYGIEGNLQDPNNPAYQDPEYVDAVSTCAARTDIVSVLQEVQATRANLTPEQVQQRNEVFTTLRTCLEAKGWTVETSTSEIGLLEPVVFQNADGVLDERDINQCLTEQNLDGD